MKTLVVVLSLTVCCTLLANAQLTPSVVTATNELADGRVALTVRNISQMPIRACLVTDEHVNERGQIIAKGFHYYDSVTDPRTANPILPGQEKSFTYGGRGGTPPVVKVVAAIYEDGTSYGDQDGVKLILERRKYILQVIEEALSILEAASRQHAEREQLIERFKVFGEEHTKTAPDYEHVLYAKGISDTVLGNLTRGQRGVDVAAIPIEQIMSHVIAQLRQSCSDINNAKPSVGAK